MGTIAAILTIIATLCGVIKVAMNEKRKQQRQALQDGRDAIASGDASKLTAAMSRLNRIIIIAALLLFFTGCSRPVIIHPIDKEDIIRVKKGEPVTAPKDGWFLSDLYVDEVMQAKVESK